MREYGRISTAFWASADMRALSCDGRMLALYLMTSPHSTAAGVCRLSDGYVCDDIQWTPDRVAQAFAELAAAGFAHRCASTAWVWVVKHLEWNAPENPNQVKAVRRAAAAVPASCEWRAQFEQQNAQWLATPPAPPTGSATKDPAVPPASAPPTPAPAPAETPAPAQSAATSASQNAPPEQLPNRFGTVPEPFRNGFETVSKRFRNTEPEPEPNTKPELQSYPSSHDHPAHARGDDDAPDPCDVAEWIQVWQNDFGVSVSATSIHDRKKFWPLAAGWLKAGITRRQMRAAVQRAHDTATEAIAYLPAYADRVLATMQAPPRRAAAAPVAFAVANARHAAATVAALAPGVANTAHLVPACHPLDFSAPFGANVIDLEPTHHVPAIACH